MLRKDVEADAQKIYGISGDEAIKKYLYDLYWVQNISTKTIAEQYESTEPTVRKLMRSVGIKMKSPGGGIYFEEALKNNKYIDANDFFCRNATKSKMDMARELGVSFKSLCTHYERWVETFK